MTEELREKMASMVSKSSVAYLASVDEEGYPRVVPMAVIQTDGIAHIWFATGLESQKVQHYKKNPKASVCIQDQHDGITLTGTVEVLQDGETRKKMWVDWFIEHFPGGIDDPNYCLLKFFPKKALIWIDQQFESFDLTDEKT